MKKFLLLLLTLCSLNVSAANKYDNPDTLFVARDGSCEFRNVQDAIEVCRAYMTYHKVIFIKNGIYKEKVTVHHWLTNIELCGEDAEKTIITWDDHANVPIAGTQSPMGTFRTWTLKVEGSDITLKNLSIENNSARKGQAVSLHTTGDRIHVLGCRLLGHQDTLFTGVANTHLLFKNCYICGTTDFIFGPSTAWFEGCLIENKNDSYVTAASTPGDVKYGYVFNNCTLRAMSPDAPLVGDALGAPKPNATKCYLGRPWRPYAYTLFMNCDLGEHIRPQGWHNWGNKNNEQTARYMEYNNRGAGAAKEGRAPWAKQLTKKDVKDITMKNVIGWEE